MLKTNNNVNLNKIRIKHVLKYNKKSGSKSTDNASVHYICPTDVAQNCRNLLLVSLVKILIYFFLVFLTQMNLLFAN